MAKAISPIIATVLLIAFTITIGTIVVSWSTTFTQSQTIATEEKATARIKCSYGDLYIEKAKYNHTLTKLSLWLKNQAGTVDAVLSNITLSVILTNASTNIYSVLPSENLNPGDTKVYYNSSIQNGCNIDEVWVTTNCEDARDKKKSTQIEISGC